MNYRDGLILPAKDMGPAGTETFDIKYKVPISRIELTFKTTKVLYNMTAPGPANIPKIELVDGSKALHSLSGYTNQALAYFSRGNIAMEHGQHIQSLSEIDTYVIDFGRYLGDPLLAFDPTRFDNPQLKVTWDEDLADTSVTVNSLEIWAHLFDEKKIMPIGFLRAREHWSSAMGADGSKEEISLPEDEVIRQILLRAYRDGYEPWYQIDAAKLDENAEERIPFDYTDLEMYYRRMKSHWKMLVVPFIAEPYGTARVFYIPATDYWAHVSVIPVATSSYGYMSGTDAKGGKVSLINSVNAQVVGVSRGYLPWHCFQFPFGKQDDPEDWYDPKGKAPRLTITSHASGIAGTGTVVVESLYKY